MKTGKNTTPLRVALIYAVLSALWAFFSNTMMEFNAAALDHGHIVFQIIEDWLFVSISASLIYFILQKDIRILRESEERYRGIFENSWVINTIVDAGGRYVMINKNAAALHNKAAEDLVGKSIFDYLPGETAARHYEFNRELLLTGGRREYEDTFELPSGSRTFLIVDQCLKDGNGVNYAIQSSGIDITGRKQAEQALHESEALYRQAIETAGAVPYREVYPTESDLRVEYQFIGEGIRQITGYGPEEFNAALWEQLTLEVHPLEDLAGYSVNEAIERVRTGRNPIWKCDTRIQARDGSIHWVFEAAVELRNELGVSHGSIGMYQDITARKQAEESLRKSEQRLQVFFNQSLDGFFFCDFEEPMEWKHSTNRDETLEYIINTKRFTDVNDALLKQYDIVREQFLSRTTKDFFAHDLEQGRALRRELFDKGQLHIETYERRENGESVWFEGEYVCLYDQQERITGFFGIQRDITERKRSESELRRHIRNTTTMYELSRQIHTSLDLNQIYQTMHQAVQKIMPCDVFLIALLDAPNQEIHSVYLWDLDKLYPDERSPLGLGLTDYIISSGEPLCVNQWDETHDRMTRAVHFGSEQNTRSILAVPLFKIDGSCFGMMSAQAYAAQAYTAEHEQLLTTLANQVSKAIENANLFIEVQKELAERKRAEQGLIIAEEKYRSIFENAVDGIYQSSPDGRFLTVNPAFARMLGYDSPQEMTETITDIARQIYGETSQREGFMQQLEEQGGVTGFEYQMRRKDCSVIWVSENARLVYDSAGGAPYYEGIVEDITMRKKAEEQLRESEEKHRTFIEQSSEGITLADEQGNIIEWNHAREVLTGLSSGEVMGKPYWDMRLLLSPPDMRTPEVLQRIKSTTLEMLRTGQSPIFNRIVQGEMTTASGEVKSIEQITFPVKTKQGYCIGSVLRDITERKQAELQIEEQLKRLSALHTIESVIKSSFDLKSTLDILLTQLTVQLKVDAASILLFNKETLTLNYSAGHGFHSTAVQHTKLKHGQGFAGNLLVSREIIHIPDLTREEGELTKALAQAGEKFVAYVGVPLIAKSQIVGVLEIFQRSQLNPNPDWFDFLEMLADQAAIAIDNAQLFENLQRTNLELTLAYDATIEGWSHALDLRDKETQGHSQRVTTLTLKLAGQMGIREADIVHIRRGSLLHDIGKMGTPDHILFKAGDLDPEEWKLMRLHPLHAHEMLASIPYLKPALEIPYSHHEKWDGSGYPRGLKGEEIPLSARIFAIADVWDALRSDRPYRPAWSAKNARDYIREQAGKHFDPQVVEVFLKLVADE